MNKAPYFQKTSNPRIISNTVVLVNKCKMCNADHFIGSCKRFLELNIQERRNIVKENNLCFNCLKLNHKVMHCKSSNCKKCNRKHHTLLHNDERLFEASTSTIPTNSMLKSKEDANNIALNTCLHSSITNQILLATAMIKIKDKFGKYHYVRALLDSGSQTSFIRQRLADKLKLSQREVHINVSGIGGSLQRINKSMTISIQSAYTSNFGIEINCLIANTLRQILPIKTIDKENIRIPHGIKLADPDFNVARDFDVLIGADIFWELLRDGKFKLSNGPILQETVLGWIISGYFNTKPKEVVTFCSHASVSFALERFWQLENCIEVKGKDENVELESHFLKKLERDSTGRVIQG